MKVLQRLWAWLKKVAQRMWTMFKGEVNEKKDLFKNASPSTVINTCKKEAFRFFVAGLKKCGTAQLQPRNIFRKALSYVSHPYEDCWEGTTPKLLGVVSNLVKAVGTTVWTGKESSWMDSITLNFPLQVRE